MTTDMAAPTEAVIDDDLDCDISDIVLDLDRSSAEDEFHSDVDTVSHGRHGCQDGDGGDNGAAEAAFRWLAGDGACVDGAEQEEARSLSSADSGVTDDGSLALTAGHLDCDIFDFDVIVQALDLDVSSAGDEFLSSTACYSAIFSDADIVSHRRHGCEDGDGDSGVTAATCRWLLAGLADNDACVDGAEEEEASGLSLPAGVASDGSLALAASDGAAAEAMSAYVAELKRFLLDEDAPCGEQLEEDLVGVVEDYFASDQLLATIEVFPAAGLAEPPTADGEEEENDNVLAAREDQQSASRKRVRYE